MGEGDVGEAFGDPGAELVEKAQAQGLGDRLLVREELVDGADGHAGPFRDPRGGQVVVADLVEEFGAAVEHALDADHAALLCRQPA